MAETKIKTNTKFEAGEKGTGTISFEVPVEIVNQAVDQAFKRAVNNINVPGFRKGKIPKSIFMQRFGEESLYDQAVNIAVDQVFDSVIEESGVAIVGQPNLEPVEIKKGQPWKFHAHVELAPNVKLGKYKDIEVKVDPVKIDASQVDHELEHMQEAQAELVPADAKTKVKDADQVNIDFDGSVDGVHFDGGKAENFLLTIGSGQFIPGFEDQIIGHKTGDEFDVKVKFPKDYQAEDLADKDAVFAVKLHEIKTKQLPKLDDEFAKDVDSSVKTLAELKKSIKTRLEEASKEEFDAKVEDAVIEKVVKDAKLDGDVPQAMIQQDIRQQMDQYFASMSQQGINPQMYFQMTGTTEAQMRESIAKESPIRVKTNLVLEEIVRQEKINPNEKEILEEIDRLATQYNMKKEQVRATLPDSLIKHDIAIRKVVAMIQDSAKVKK